MSLVQGIDSFARNSVNRFFFYNPYLEGLISYLYYTPDRRMPEVPISQKTQGYLDVLRRDGVVILPGALPKVADALNETYFEVLEGKRPGAGKFQFHDTGARVDASGTQRVKLSYRDPILEPLLWDPEICGLVYNYYHRQPYYRDLPIAILNAPKTDVSKRVEVASKYHLDLFHQLTIQFLVSDLTSRDTRLQYAVGSHLERKFGRDRYAFTDEDVEENYKIMDCVGPKGTIVIMDAGAGLHRGTFVPGTIRKTIHILLQTGHSVNTYGKMDTLDGWKAYEKFPRHMQKMMDKAIV